MIKYAILSTACLAASLSSSFAQDSSATLKAPKDHKSYIMSEDLWKTSLVDFQKQQEGLQFEWQTEQKRGLRSTVKNSLFGTNSGETLISGKDGALARIKFSVYNRGDDRPMTSSVLNTRFNQLKTALDEATGSNHKEIKRRNNAVKITSYMWKTSTSAFLLEKSSTGNRAEFLRLRVAPARDASKGNKTASRSTLRSNVKKDNNGDVWIDNIPMVDQGEKGYCVCASSARIYQYYGREVSMHEIAQMVGADNQGTDPVKMVAAFKKAAGKLNSRVVLMYEYPKFMTKPLEKMSNSNHKSMDREIVSDINKYQSLAKKKKTGLLNIDGKVGGRAKTGGTYDLGYVQYSMDPEIYKECMVKKSSYKRFLSNVKKYINEGVPVGWGLQLGMFKEDGLPQSRGGHMRLIIGYNEKKGTIIYSDSWGTGHAKKSMPAGNAFCMTSVLLALPPTR